MKTRYPNLQNTYLKEKLVILSVYIFKNQEDRKKCEKTKKNMMMHLMSLVKPKSTNPKSSRWREIVKKIRAEISDRERKKTGSMKQNCFFEKLKLASP